MSNQFIFANFISTTLASAVASGDTSISIANASGIPSISAGQQLAMVLTDAATQSTFEVIYATAISGTTVTVTRAQEGTTALSWLIGAIVRIAPTKGQMAALKQIGSSQIIALAEGGTGIAATSDANLLQTLGTFQATQSDNTKTVVAMVSAAPTSGNLAKFTDASGTVGDSGVSPTGLVSGPASAVSSNIAVFSGTTGKLIADSGVPALSMPAGGTTGQSLIKNSGTNFDTKWGAPVLSAMNASLGADVTLTTSMQTLVSVAQGTTGTWFVAAYGTFANSTGAGVIQVELTDGTTVIDSGQIYIVSGTTTAISLGGYLASPAANIELRALATAASGGTNTAKYNATGLLKDTAISAFRIS